MDVRELLIEQYGYAPDDLVLEVRGKRIYAYKPCELKEEGHEGIYIGAIEKDGIRLTIEGAFIIGPKAEKNVIELDDEKARAWMSGKDVEVGVKGNAWVILKWRNFWLGGGKLVDGVVKNYVPKERRLVL
ncbi:methyltransferase RsmF C-terminal domain-like protein [Pyrococcus abyssi]|uniref:rRNA small subunit methyltransferase F RNA-binding PUA-like domain-containing protein n=1 Tax=Pyrococcus abyssi (strain GE5 / Orsay) TaxID=272844 RepID=Q9UZZ1_PYRAB|nr:hypothetical protein [Pyrococcus abyssi]CAB49915.1 Hypothetical protein PAB0673 [Pyrococcus abyssi GE5]CCE70413.1 TPA: hypothetical protein PAB0673 [Pyrococcus abyssi GE5]